MTICYVFQLFYIADMGAEQRCLTKVALEKFGWNVCALVRGGLKAIFI